MTQIRYIVLTMMLTVFVATPMMVLAQYGNNDTGTPGETYTNTGTGENVGTNAGGRGDGRGTLDNPLESDTITEFLLKILDVLLVFALPIVVLFIMYAGFLYITARGDTAKISKAHSALTWSVIGGVIIFGARVIINVIQNTVESL